MGNKKSLPSTSNTLSNSKSYPINKYPMEAEEISYGSSPNFRDDEKISKKNSLQQTQNLTSKDVETATKLTFKLKKKAIQSSSFNVQTFPMLISLITNNIKTTSKAPLDLICVIDRSGSMNGENKIGLVKESFNYLLKFLGDQDRLSIVIFDDQASRLVPLMRMTQKNKKKVLSKLEPVYGRGSTDINLGMIQAFEAANHPKALIEVKQKNSFSFIKFIFFYTSSK